MSDDPSREKPNVARARDVAIAAVMAAVAFVLFSSTLFQGVPISKIHVIAEWDSIFKNFSTGQSQLMDPSLILLMVPYYLMVGRAWHQLEVPLWNPLSGFGMPLLADPQALALSILHLPLALNPSISAYNFVLIIELAILSSGGFVLGKTLGLSRLAAVFLGLTLLLCPFEQWYLELLGNGYCLIPFLLAAFVNVSKSRTVISALLAGIAASVMVLSAHPELSFCSITFASLLMFLLAEIKSWKRMLVLLIIAGAVAFCLSAPMLLPFVEYLIHSDSYKFGNRAPAYYPWQTLAFNLIQPGYGGASPFLGVLAMMSLPFGIAIICGAIKNKLWNEFSSRAAVCIGGLSIAAWAISAKVFPLGLLLTRKPFSYVVVTYTFPVLIVFIAVLAAMGLERLLSMGFRDASEKFEGKSFSHSTIDWVLLAVSLIVVALFPTLIKLLHVKLNVANFDMTLPSMDLTSKDWARDAVIAGVIAGMVAFGATMRRGASARVLSALVIICLCAGAFSQLAVSKKSLAPRPNFSYPETDTLSMLISLGDKRTIATGDHTMRPNTNLAYGLKDARFHNPIFPERYLPFLEKAGAKLDEFNQVFSDSPSKMIDIASIAQVVTGDALVEESCFNSNTVQVSPLPNFEESVSLSSARYAVDDVSRCVAIETNWKVNGKSDPFSYCMSLETSDGSPIWISDRKPISDKISLIAAPIRSSTKDGDELALRLSVFDANAGRFLSPAGQAEGASGVVIAKFTVPPVVKAMENSSGRFKLLYETKEGMRIYENTHSLPDAYVSPAAVFVDTAEQALEKVSTKDFDPHTTVVIEGKSSEQPSPAANTEARILRRSPTHMLVQAQSSQPAFLVVTDIWYPGWTATINGASQEILHANYSFRAVKIPAGKTNIDFNYRPMPFYVGVALWLLALISIAVVFVRSRLAKKQNSPTS